jgi:beta-1,4-glucosyltransferase
MNSVAGRQESVTIAGYAVRVGVSAHLVEELLAALDRKQQRVLLFANTNFAVQCRHLQEAMNRDGVIVVNDGIGMDVAALLIRGRRFPENLNGTDFIPYFLANANHKLKIFLLGGTTTAVNGAARHIERELGHHIVGVCDGYAGMKDQEFLLATIARAKPDLLLVALGNPLQEEWILENSDNCQVGILMGVGALFDYISGEQRRAPIIFRHLRLEWFFRLANEPKRLLYRYSIGFLHFLYLCIRDRKSQMPRLKG